MTSTPPKPDQEDIILITEHRISCDGGGGALGHPKVFLDVGSDGEVICGYCGRRFVLKGSKADTHHN